MLNKRLSSVVSTEKHLDSEENLKVSNEQKTLNLFEQPNQESTILANDNSVLSPLMPITSVNADESIPSTSAF